MVRRLDISRWAHWKRLDMALLLSYGFETVFHDLLILSMIQQRSLLTLWRVLAFSAAIICVAALARIVSFVRCAEMIALKDSNLHRDQFQALQIGKMVSILLFSLYICLVAYSVWSRSWKVSTIWIRDSSRTASTISR